MLYSIAAYLTPEQKARALSRSYTPNLGGMRRDSEGCCPLGVALGRSITAFLSSRAPTPAAVADAVVPFRDARSGPPWRDVYLAAQRFIEDWDWGLLVPDRLREALGMDDDVEATA